MDTAIHVGSEITQDSAERLKGLIETVFRVGAETRMEQSTIVEALHLVGKLATISNVSINDVTISGDNHVHMPESGAAAPHGEG